MLDITWRCPRASQNCMSWAWIRGLLHRMQISFLPSSNMSASDTGGKHWFNRITILADFILHYYIDFILLFLQNRELLQWWHLVQSFVGAPHAIGVTSILVTSLRASQASPTLLRSSQMSAIMSRASLVATTSSIVSQTSPTGASHSNVSERKWTEVGQLKWNELIQYYYPCRRLCPASFVVSRAFSQTNQQINQRRWFIMRDYLKGFKENLI